MPYCDQATLELVARGAEKLIQICDQDDTGELDTVKMARAVALAESTVNSYLRKVARVPLATPSDLIQHLTAAVAVYLLRTWGNSITPDQEKHYVEVTQATLVQMSEGKIGFDTDPSPPVHGDAADGPYDRDASFAVSKDKLGGLIW